MSPDRLVNLACNRLLNHPIEGRATRAIQPKRDIRPFDVASYDLYKFNPQDWETRKKFYPYFKNRGTNLYTQYAFHRHSRLVTEHHGDGATCTNLAFPLTLPKGNGAVVGFEERGCARMDGIGSYKGKAEGSSLSEGLWIASPVKTLPAETKRICRFKSTYDTMAYHQLNQKWNKELRRGAFIFTGGAPDQRQFKAMIEATPYAYHHFCFDGDRVGQIFATNLTLTRAGKTFTGSVTKDDKLLVRTSGEESQNYEVKLKSFDSHRIIDVLLYPREVYREDGMFGCRTIGSRYLQEMSMMCQDEYKVALAEGSASEETLKGMRQNIMVIEDTICNLPTSGEDSTDLIVYEPADRGYKGWDEQLLAKVKLQESVHKESARREEPEQERQIRFHR